MEIEWSKLKESKKKKYLDEEKKDSQSYMSEMKEYKKKEE
jgi:hypothetical protein